MSGAFTLGSSPWRQALVPASFRSISFYVERAAIESGRRIAVHEFAKRDTPLSEDMGRRALRYTVSAYVIGPSYNVSRDLLISALEAPGSGQLILPTQGTVTVYCERFTETEQREKGGIAVFECTFVEAGSVTGTSSVTQDTAAAATSAAQSLITATQGSVTASLGAVLAS